MSSSQHFIFLHSWTFVVVSLILRGVITDAFFPKEGGLRRLLPHHQARQRTSSSSSLSSSSIFMVAYGGRTTPPSSSSSPGGATATAATTGVPAFNLDPSSTAIVFIEYQNEFTTEGGKLHEAVKDCMEQTNSKSIEITTTTSTQKIITTTTPPPASSSSWTCALFGDTDTDTHLHTWTDDLFPLVFLYAYIIFIYHCGIICKKCLKILSNLQDWHDP